MKYIKGFDKIIENQTTENLDEAVNASGYIKAGKLGYNDQFLGRRSLAWTLSVDLGLKATDQYVGPWIGFDSVEMYALGKKGGTILDDALTNKYTYEELKAAAAKYLGIKESIEESVNESFFGNKSMYLNDVSELITSFGNDFEPSEIVDNAKAIEKDLMKTVKIAVKELVGYAKDNLGESVTEARFVKSYDTKVNDAETKKDVLKVYPKAEFYVGKISHFFGELEPNLFFKAYYADWYKKDTGKSIKGDFKITSVYSKKGSNYVHLFNELEESVVTEAKKFKPGDMWSSDFDYEGMLKHGLKVNEKTPIKMLNKLFDSATDVNYHTPFRNLGIAIDWIEDGDKAGAKDYIKNFHDDIKAEMKSQGIK